MGSECIRVRLLGSLEVQRRNQDGAWSPVDREAFGRPKHARSVLKRLLAAPGRRLPRGQIQEDLWPELDMSLADSYLYNAIAKIRSAIGRELVSTNDAVYQLAGQALVWVDLDQVEALMRQIEDQGHLSADAIAILEETLGYLKRGPALEGEDGTWCYGLRRKAEDATRKSRLWLAEAYEAREKLWQAGEQYRALCQQMPPDEEALRAWMVMLARAGKTQDALKCYQDVKASTEAQSYVLSPAIERFADELAADRMSENLSGDLVMPGTHLDLLQRFSHAFGSQTPIDRGLLQILEARTQHYWQVRHAASISSSDLWRYVAPQIQRSLTFLEGPLFPEQRAQICAMLSQSAILAGVLTYDSGRQPAARSWYKLAIQAAHEAGTPKLAAIALGWMVFTWTYVHDYRQALACVQQALSEARHFSDDLLLAWLKANEAEIQIYLAQKHDSLAALKQAEGLIDQEPSAEQYLFNLNPVQLLGYKGACFQRLYRRDDPGTKSFLRDAQEALQHAIASPTSMRRQVTFLHDLAGTYARSGEIEAACAIIERSFPFLTELGEKTAQKRLEAVRGLLSEASDTPVVQALDEQIAVLVGPT